MLAAFWTTVAYVFGSVNKEELFASLSEEERHVVMDFIRVVLRHQNPQRHQVVAPSLITAEEAELYRQGHLVKAIKAYRARTGANLRESKTAVENAACLLGLPVSEYLVRTDFWSTSEAFGTRCTRAEIHALVTQGLAQATEKQHARINGAFADFVGMEECRQALILAAEKLQLKIA